MLVHINGVGHRTNGPQYELEDLTEQFLTEVNRAMYRLRHGDRDLQVNISCSVDVEIKEGGWFK